jgi:hypothetical protein
VYQATSAHDAPTCIHTQLVSAIIIVAMTAAAAAASAQTPRELLLHLHLDFSQ